MSWYNIGLVFIPAYALIWLAMIVINRKRAKPVEDPEIYARDGKGKMYWLGFYPQLFLLAASVLVPIHRGLAAWVGLGVLLLGLAVNLNAMFSFAASGPGLNTTGIYRFSRNPMYVSGFAMIVGCLLMGLPGHPGYYLFLALAVYWMLGTHWCVLREERFLQGKYGETFAQYRRSVPRYLIF